MKIEETTDPIKAIYQLNNGLLALTHAMAATNPEQTMLRLAAAIYASRDQGVGDGILMETFQRAFPGQQLPQVVSEAELNAIIKQQAGNS